MPTNVDNWLTRRGAGALLNLQRTPMVAGTDGIAANPKKAQANKNFSHTNQYLTNWPTKSVVKISGDPGIEMNALELETKYTEKITGIGLAYSQVDTGDTTSAGFIELIVGIASGSAGAGPGVCGIKWPQYFGGSNYNSYETASYVANEPYEEDSDGDGVPEQYYRAYECSIQLLPVLPLSGFYHEYVVTSYSITDSLTTPVVKANSVTHTAYSDWDVSADFNGSELYATDILANITATSPSSSVAFCSRHPDDSAHGLASYVYKSDNIPFLQYQTTSTNRVGIIGSYRQAATDSPLTACLEADCECKFFYTPDACDDCWYAGKTVTIEITYKQIQFTQTSVSLSGNQLEKSVTMGSATTHSTVTKTLTLPSGRTRVQVGDTFSVPTSAGYAVVIDDIKLVSVT